MKRGKKRGLLAEMMTMTQSELLGVAALYVHKAEEKVKMMESGFHAPESRIRCRDEMNAYLDVARAYHEHAKLRFNGERRR